ncbi:hypothetical protein Mapa_009586 [Marchantia paleacea]|nr:hypothetical protein Mapa_009586 [Marchantia paleacea]
MHVLWLQPSSDHSDTRYRALKTSGKFNTDCGTGAQNDAITAYRLNRRTLTLMATGGSMESEALRHIVMIKVADKENIDKVVQMLVNLGKGIPGVQWNTFAVNTDIGLVETNCDVVLTIDFPDKKNFSEYRTHPDHVAVIKANKPLVAWLSAIQYSLAPKQ